MNVQNAIKVETAVAIQNVVSTSMDRNEILGIKSDADRVAHQTRPNSPMYAAMSRVSDSCSRRLLAIARTPSLVSMAH